VQICIPNANLHVFPDRVGSLFYSKSCVTLPSHFQRVSQAGSLAEYNSLVQAMDSSWRWDEQVRLLRVCAESAWPGTIPVPGNRRYAMHKKIAFLLFLALLANCATITRGSTETFVIETTPPGAEAILSTGLYCVTPCSLRIRRRGDFVVTINREGYETVSATITSSIDTAGGGALAGNIILGGIIGAGVDAGTGATLAHQPNPLVVELVPLQEDQ